MDLNCLKYQGYHVFLDYITDPVTETPEEFAEWVTLALDLAIKTNGIRIVHQKSCVFDGSVSPPGFAIGFLLDESHVTAHSYSDRGLLALDIFTCGKDAQLKTMGIAHDIDAILKEKLNVQKWDMQVMQRFPYKAPYNK